MDYRKLIESMTPDVYAALKRAVELGKWPNGERLSAEQRKTCLEAVIAYDHRKKPEEQRTGYIHTRRHDHCGGAGEVADPDEPRPLTWK